MKQKIISSLESNVKWLWIIFWVNLLAFVGSIAISIIVFTDAMHVANAASAGNDDGLLVKLDSFFKRFIALLIIIIIIGIALFIVEIVIFVRFLGVGAELYNYPPQTVATIKKACILGYCYFASCFFIWVPFIGWIANLVLMFFAIGSSKHALVVARNLPSSQLYNQQPPQNNQNLPSNNNQQPPQNNPHPPSNNNPQPPQNNPQLPPK